MTWFWLNLLNLDLVIFFILSFLVEMNFLPFQSGKTGHFVVKGWVSLRLNKFRKSQLVGFEKSEPSKWTLHHLWQSQTLSNQCTVGRTKNTSKGFYKISFLYCKICANLLLQHILTMIMYLNVQFDWNSLDFV